MLSNVSLKIPDSKMSGICTLLILIVSNINTIFGGFIIYGYGGSIHCDGLYGNGYYNRNDANNYCLQKHGTTLATVTNINDFREFQSVLGWGTPVWIGMKRNPNNLNQFIQEDGTPVTWIQWGTVWHNPGPPSLSKKCVGYYEYTGLWHANWRCEARLCTFACDAPNPNDQTVFHKILTSDLGTKAPSTKPTIGSELIYLFLSNKVYIYDTNEYRSKCDASVVGDGWKLVRHVPAGALWHTATDNLRGTSIYGTWSLNNDASLFSIKFEHINYNEYLFATGNCKYWLISSKQQVLTQGGKFDAKICSSVINNSSYYARWWNRPDHFEEPWYIYLYIHLYEIIYLTRTYRITYRDFPSATVLYGQSGHHLWWGNIRNADEGADVYIRLANEFSQGSCLKQSNAPTISPTINPEPTQAPTTLESQLRDLNNENTLKTCPVNDDSTTFNGIINEGDTYGLQLVKELGTCNNVNEYSFEIELDSITYINDGNLVFIITDGDKYFAIINEYYNINGNGFGYYISPESNTKLLEFNNNVTGPWLINLAYKNDVSNWDRESNPMDTANELPVKIIVDIDIIIGIITVGVYKNGIKKLEYKYLDSFTIGNQLSLYIQPLNNGDAFDIKCPKVTMNCLSNDVCFYDNPSIIDTGNGWLTYESEKPRILYKAVTKDNLINEDDSRLPAYLTHDTSSDTWTEFNKQCFDDYGTALATIKTRKIQNLVIKSMIDNGCENAWFGLTDIKGPYDYKFTNGDSVDGNDFVAWSNTLPNPDPNSYTDTIGSNGYISYMSSLSDYQCGLFYWGDETSTAKHECGICYIIDTSNPTLTPSISPTKSPTLAPTLTPSLTPTLTPTTSPTLNPTTTPSKSPTLDGCDFAYSDYMFKCHGIVDSDHDNVGAKTNKLNFNTNGNNGYIDNSYVNVIIGSIMAVLIISNIIFYVKSRNKGKIDYKKIDYNYSSNDDEYTSESDINSNNENKQML